MANRSKTESSSPNVRWPRLVRRLMKRFGQEPPTLSRKTRNEAVLFFLGVGVVVGSLWWIFGGQQ